MQQFYLAGGTALALQMGHRQSRDLAFSPCSPWPRCPISPISNHFSDGFAT